MPPKRSLPFRTSTLPLSFTRPHKPSLLYSTPLLPSSCPALALSIRIRLAILKPPLPLLVLLPLSLYPILALSVLAIPYDRHYNFNLLELRLQYQPLCLGPRHPHPSFFRAFQPLPGLPHCRMVRFQELRVVNPLPNSRLKRCFLRPNLGQTQPQQRKITSRALVLVPVCASSGMKTIP